MKTVTVFEARNHFAKTLDAAKKDVIIVTRNGRPVAAIQAIDDDGIEDLLLERSERFWAMIAIAPGAANQLRSRHCGGKSRAGGRLLPGPAVRAPAAGRAVRMRKMG